MTSHLINSSLSARSPANRPQNIWDTVEGMISLRPATMADASDLANVWIRAWQTGYQGQIDAAYLAGLAPERVSARFSLLLSAGPGEACTVAVDANGVVIGVCSVGRPRDDMPDGVGEVYSVNVDPGHWRAGTGTALIDNAERVLADRGYTSAYLWALETNTKAHNLYLRRGWRRGARAKSVDGIPGSLRAIDFCRDLKTGNA